MWGCNFDSNIPFFGPFLSHGIFSVIIWGIVLFLLIFFIIKIGKGNENRNATNYSDKRDSMEILRIRYARGEIDNEEFNRMKQALL